MYQLTALASNSMQLHEMSNKWVRWSTPRNNMLLLNGLVRPKAAEDRMFDCNLKNILTAIKLPLLVKAGLRVVLPTLFLSACAIATELYVPTPPPPVPHMPEPVAPAEGIELSQFNEVVFSWTATEHAVRYEFHVFNALNNDTQQYLLTDLKPDQNCINEICSISLQLDLPESTQHAWRVRAINESGSSQWTRKLFSWES